MIHEPVLCRGERKKKTATNPTQYVKLKYNSKKKKRKQMAACKGRFVRLKALAVILL